MLITSILALFNQNVGFFCPSCENIVSGKMQHVCKRSLCPHCKCIANCVGELQKCPSCCCVFRGSECLANHCTENKSPMYRNVCQQVKACDYCHFDLKAKNGQYLVHTSGYRRDAYKRGVNDEHVCFGAMINLFAEDRKRRIRYPFKDPTNWETRPIQQARWTQRRIRMYDDFVIERQLLEAQRLISKTHVKTA